MMGFNRCIVCNKKNPYGSADEAFEHNWNKLIFRSPVKLYKYTGLICPECSRNKIIPMFKKRREQ